MRASQTFHNVFKCLTPRKKRDERSESEIKWKQKVERISMQLANTFFDSHCACRVRESQKTVIIGESESEKAAIASTRNSSHRTMFYQKIVSTFSVFPRSSPRTVDFCRKLSQSVELKRTLFTKCIIINCFLSVCGKAERRRH